MQSTNKLLKQNGSSVILKNATPLYLSADAIRECRDTSKLSDSYNGYCGEKDKDLIDRIGNKMKHESVLEHLVYNFSIKNVSRALLQEISRTRIASPTVKSSRYTLKELRNEAPFLTDDSISEIFKNCSDNKLDNLYKRASKYLIRTGNKDVDITSLIQLDLLRMNIFEGISNDIAKYNIPDSYKTSITLTINARSLQNLLRLRTNKDALWEYRDLAYNIFDKLPEDHKYLFKHCLYPINK